ncbi:hypothetical protein OAO87_03200 [bacterium]|nr:hypothetical protein [bacterium]
MVLARAESNPRGTGQTSVTAYTYTYIQHAPITPFLFTVTCACRISRRWKRSLCATSLLILASSHVLLCEGSSPYAGSLAAALSLTSVAYHATHSPKVRAADVLLLWLVGVTGFTQCVAYTVLRGPELGWSLCLLCLLGLVGIVSSDRCYVGERCANKIIKLPWHVLVHVLTGLGILALALGNHTSRAGGGGGGLVVSALWRADVVRTVDAWVRVGAATALLVTLTSAAHVLSGHSEPPLDLPPSKQRRTEAKGRTAKVG